MLPSLSPVLLAEQEEGAPARSPVTAIGVANSVTLAGKRLRLAAIRDSERDRVRDFVPAGETAEKWTARYSQREFSQPISPIKYANAVTELTASQGGKVVSTVAGPGETASLVLVLHSLVLPASEVSAWRFFVRDGRLICLQYTERIEGVDHAAAAETLAREKSAGWLRELQVQRPWVGLQAIAAADDGSE